MGDKEMVSVRIETDTKDRIERYGEDHDVSQSTAIRRLLEKGADLEDAGLTVAASQQSTKESKEEEDKMVADGGQVIRPMLSSMASISAYSLLALFALVLLRVFAGIIVGPLDLVVLLALTMTVSVPLACIVPILYSEFPEKADRFLESQVRKIPSIDRRSKA